MGFTEKQYNGKWVGYYTYGNGYSERVRGKSVPFTLVMEVDGRGQMKGHILDDGYADQMDARATVEGSIHGSNIAFVKTYRHHWVTNEDGSVEVNKRRPSQEVHYSGEYRSLYFAGEWKIFTSMVAPDGSVRQIVSSGSWILHREEPDAASERAD